MVFKSAPFAALLSAFLLAACSPKAGESVVLEVGPSKVTLKEFEDFYARNSVAGDTLSNTPLAERERFLDLLTRYKLKLQDAADRNLAEDPEVNKELRDYRASLATTYIIEKEITEPGIRLLYDRKTEEIRARHILVAVKPEASPADTLTAYRKAVEIIGRLNAGADFDSLAMTESEDPTVKSNRGDLYYFTGGQMVMPFEQGAYAMKVGEISRTPIRTSFGYHVIKITARQPVRGSINVRHIMTLIKYPATNDSGTAMCIVSHGIFSPAQLNSTMHPSVHNPIAVGNAVPSSSGSYDSTKNNGRSVPSTSTVKFPAWSVSRPLKNGRFCVIHSSTPGVNQR